MPDIMSAREILDRIVSFPTVSRDSNLELVAWIENYLAGFGVTATRVWNEDRTKASLFASIGPDVPGGVVLSGHTDVVPVDGQPWSQDPWTVVERDGRLYGRGTCDMKGFDALALAAVPKALSRGLRRPIHLAFSRDEEIGLLGAPDLARAMRDTLPPAQAVIVGEPTGLKVVSGHKTCDAYEVHVRGHEVHSSRLHEGVSAVMTAARLVEWIRLQTEANAAKPVDPVAALFDPPFTTLHVGQISGGTAHNITARDCTFPVDVRAVPNEGAEIWLQALRAEAARIEAEIRRIAPAAAITVDVLAPGPGVRPEENGAAEALVRRLTGDNSVNAVSYCTDGGYFQAEGFSVVVCGPGDIAQAHQPDEYITAEQFTAGEQFLDRLIDELAA